MRQALHIFRKDTRRLWIELLITLASLAIVTWIEWRDVSPGKTYQFSRWYLQTLPVVVLFLAWWFLVVRLIHGETLVGDRQFWITRPYVWYKLLAAKVLFLIAWIGVPLFISETVLLLIDRAPISRHLGILLENTGGVLLVAVLPVMIIAALSRNVTQFVIGAVGIVLMIIGMIALDSYAPSSHVSGAGSDLADNVQGLTLISLGALAILLQYSRRRRAAALWAVVAAVVSLPIIVVATPYRSLVEQHFPLVLPGQLPFQLAFGHNEEGKESGLTFNNGTKVTLNFPGQISGVAQDRIVEVPGVMLSLTAGDGARWQSEWSSAYEQILNGGGRMPLSVEIDGSFYAREKDKPVVARLSLLFRVLRDQNPQQVITTSHFQLPAVGPCWIDPLTNAITCRSTQRGPQELLLTFAASDSTCPPEDTSSSQDTDEADSTSEGTKKSAEPERNRVFRQLSGISTEDPLGPLATYSFSDWRGGRGRLCAGTSATFSMPVEEHQYRVDVDLGNIRLEDYASSNRFVFAR